MSFGVTKAILNLLAARVSDRIGRKPVLVTGWLLALAVPFLIIYAPAWWWIDAVGDGTCISPNNGTEPTR